MLESRKRSLLKTITWRLLGFSGAMLLGYLIFKDLPRVTLFAIVYQVCAFVLYYVHERIWSLVRWGYLEYKGIKKYYPRIRLPLKLKSYIVLLRPFTLLPPILAGVFGTLTPVPSISFDAFKVAVYVGVTLALLQAVGQIVNQAVDAELDKVAKPYRPIPRGLISEGEAMGLAWLIAIVAVARAFTVSVMFGLFSLALLFFSVFYSLKPFSPRRVNPFASVLWLALSRGFIPVLMCYTVYGGFNLALKVSVFALLWVLAYQPTKDINDIGYDRMFGIKTIPNTFGIDWFRKYAAVVSLIMYCYAYLYTPELLLLIPVSIITVYGIKVRMKKMENNLGWVMFYIGLGLIYIIEFIVNHV